jgi:transcriptional regulator with XRE-family HTH domain
MSSAKYLLTKPKRTAAQPFAAAPAAKGWTRAEADQSMTQQLGERVRAVREAQGLSLARLSEISGVPGATLSRIENNKMSPTFGVLARLMVGLGTDWAGLMGTQHLPAGERLLSFADPGEGQSTEVRQSSARILHSSDAARQLPLLVELRTGNLDDIGGLAAHPGEEFCYVLSGTLLLHMQGRAPRAMKAGASALFDSSVPHAYVAGASGSAKVLIVSQRPPGYSAEMAATAPRT